MRQATRAGAWAHVGSLAVGVVVCALLAGCTSGDQTPVPDSSTEPAPVTLFHVPRDDNAIGNGAYNAVNGTMEVTGEGCVSFTRESDGVVVTPLFGEGVEVDSDRERIRISIQPEKWVQLGPDGRSTWGANEVSQEQAREYGVPEGHPCDYGRYLAFYD